MTDDAERPFRNRYSKDDAVRPRYAGRLEDWNAQARAAQADYAALMSGPLSFQSGYLWLEDTVVGAVLPDRGAGATVLVGLNARDRASAGPQIVPGIETASGWVTITNPSAAREFIVAAIRRQRESG